MTYYRVKKEYDQRPRLIWKRHKQAYTRNGVFIAGELYTRNELQNYSISGEFFEEVRIKKTETYFFFGARFAMEDGK